MTKTPPMLVLTAAEFVRDELYWRRREGRPGTEGGVYRRLRKLLAGVPLEDPDATAKEVEPLLGQGDEPC